MKITFQLLVIWLLISSCGYQSSSNNSNHNEEKSIARDVELVPADSSNTENDMTDINFDTIRSPDTNQNPKKNLQNNSPKINQEEDDIFRFVQQKPAPKIDSLLIKKAEIIFQVETLEKSTIAIKKTIQTFNGYVSSSNDYRTNYELRTEFEIRVPNTKFEGLLTELLKQSVLLDKKSVETEDVTAEFIDTYSRIKAKREVENRYLAILQQARNVEEILKVEEQLRIIREEIEAKQGRLKYLKDRVNYSSIHLNIYEKIPYQKEAGIGFFTRLGTAFSQGWDNLLNVIIGLSYLWWFWLMLIPGTYFFRKWLKKVNQQQQYIPKNGIEKNENPEIKSES